MYLNVNGYVLRIDTNQQGNNGGGNTLKMKLDTHNKTTLNLFYLTNEI